MRSHLPSALEADLRGKIANAEICLPRTCLIGWPNCSLPHDLDPEGVERLRLQRPAPLLPPVSGLDPFDPEV